MKEHKNITPIVEKYREYKKADEAYTEAKAMLAEGGLEKDFREMVEQVGPCRFDEDDFLIRGVIIRHLVLPGQVSEAKRVMDWVADTFPPDTVLFSLMSQYTPWGRARDYPEINRKLRTGEMRAAREYMENLGLVGFCQERTSAEREYTPDFDLTGV